MSSKADAIVELYILDNWRGDHPDHADCESLHVLNPDAFGGTYGCETGCDYVTFTAIVACEHRQPEEFQFGQFGELNDLIEDLASDYAGRIEEPGTHVADV
jgi:hypothetical protein